MDDQKDVPSLAQYAQELSKARVLVIGDLMLDRFITGGIERISPEAPVPVFSVLGTSEMLGGAGNVLRNLATLGAECVLVAALGDDEAAGSVEALISRETGAVLLGPKLPSVATTLKSRFVSGGQQVLRVDEDMPNPFSSSAEVALIEAISEAPGRFGAIILSDYGKGVVSDAVIDASIKRAAQDEAPLLVDPKGSDFSRYRGAQFVTPNRAELAQATGQPTGNTEEVEQACATLVQRSGISGVLATRSEQGMTLAEMSETKTTHFTHIPVRARDVFDVAGAGDTVIGVFAAGLSIGSPPAQAARLANYAGGVVVGKPGTATVSVDELLSAIGNSEGETGLGMALTCDAARKRVQEWKEAGLSVGFTNGCFDLLHPGHIHLLKQARSVCDRLVIGLNSDASVQRLKGADRPIRTAVDRACVLSSLSVVNAVVEFEEDTPLNLIQTLRPDVLIKGADYKIDEVVGADAVKTWGGRVFLAELLEGHSTTGTVAKLPKP